MDKIRKLTKSLLILFAICVISQPTEADTSIYVFDTSQSTVAQTGGFAGVHETYSIIGQYGLSIDSDAGVALFETVDANLADETGVIYGQSLNEIFNMTGLAGTVVDNTTIQFEGKTADGTESDVRLTLSFMDGLAHMTGNTIPPPNSADMFFYDVNATATKKYTSGTGEPNDPYQIATAEDLMLLGESPEDYDKHFIMTSDIDLDPNLPGRKVFDRAVIAPDMNDTESGFQGTSFSGVFDGNDNIISHLTIEGGGSLGLFGLSVGSKISNLGLEAMDVNGTGSVVGGLVGENNGSINNCYSTGTVSGGRMHVGGLVGGNSGTITTSYSTAAVSGVYLVGGLVGRSDRSITASYSTGDVSGDENLGGLVGVNSGGNITASYSTGTVIGDDAAVGGLVGQNISGSILGCYSIADVGGWHWVGGLVGWNNSEGSILDCYFAGDVSGGREIGGLVGFNREGSITDSYWDIETSGELNMCGIQEEGANGCDPNCGKTTVEMKSQSTFTGWDFVDETENGTEDIWSICEGTNYPRFVWQIPLGDFVCPDGVTIEDFAFFMEHWLDDNCDLSNGYCEGTDLDRSGSVDVIDLEIFFENWPDKN